MRAQALEAGLEARDRIAERHVRIQPGDRPSAGPPRGALQRQQRGQFRLRALVAGAGAQPFGLIDQVEHALGEDPRTDGVLGARAVAAREAEDEARAHQVDQFVDQPGGDELAPQPVLRNFGGELARDRSREVGDQKTPGQVGIVGQRAGLELLGQIDLGVGAEHGEFGAGKAGEAAAAIAQLLVAGQRGFVAMQRAALLDRA